MRYNRKSVGSPDRLTSGTSGPALPWSPPGRGINGDLGRSSSSAFNLVGTPYRFPPDPPRSFDCWALLLWIRLELGLETPLPVEPTDYDLATMSEAIEAVKPSWQRVLVPRDGDAVLFDKTHIGVALGAGVLHAHAPAGAVVFTRWAVLQRRWPHFEVWRP